jgi:glycogen debranching enzyme
VSGETSEDVIRVQDQFYILATSPLAAAAPLVLKQGDTFGVFDRHGDCTRLGLGEQGLYHRDTRYLSRLDLRLGRARPLLLSSTVREGNDLLVADLTNPDIVLDHDAVLPRGTLHIYRAKFLWQDTCHERLRLSNHGLVAVDVSLVLLFEADFADIFEVRGTRRERRGTALPAEVGPASVVLGYRGLDGVVRRTQLDFDPAPRELGAGAARFDLRLAPQATAHLEVAVTCQAPSPRVAPAGHDHALTEAATRLAERRRSLGHVSTSNQSFNAWLQRSAADLGMMLTATEHGPYPYAGVPWFSTLFGRDGIITALEVLWVDPAPARGVLENLATLQAEESEPGRDAEPGKIVHEVRGGEMAALGEVPFGRYYGSVDATPLFVMLAAAYLERTNDVLFVRRLWPHLLRALAWMEGPGDADGDGFVEYARRSGHGLVHQGWKDSADPVSHADGRLAEGPIALCEVQAYVYGARLGAARIAEALHEDATAAALRASADALREAFAARFWSEELGTFALALDGAKRPCAVRSSNAGHALFTGIASAEHARRVAGTLLDDHSFSGWGVRTLSAAERRYNPMSYHNGSVWPHDNALVAAGLGRYGGRAQAARILTALHECAPHLDLHRMPELLCGFKRRAGEGPTLYPVACAPQAWAAGAVYLLLQSCLGLQVDAPGQRILLQSPLLPAFLDTVRIDGLMVGESVVDLALHRDGTDVALHVERRRGSLAVLMEK